MIGPVKQLAKRYWPRLRLRTILLLTFVFVAALPGVGAVFLRVYENTLVRQTEAELIAQGAALTAVAEASWPGAAPAAPRRLTPADFRPEPPQIDLNATPILPERPAPQRSAAPAADAAAAAARIAPVAIATARTTLASILLLDARGTVVNGRFARGNLGALPEVQAALAGRPTTVLRRNADYRRVYPIEWLSRAADLRIHHARPVMANGRPVAVLLLSRTPQALFSGIYEDLGKIAFGVIAIFATLVVLSGLLSRGIARPIEELSGATRGLAEGTHSELPDPPTTAAIEIQALYRDFALMAEAIDRRSRYLKDFAHAVSHEFKTPLAGIRGAIELLQDHEMAQVERDRFLANIAADAERLSQLVTRLLELARADMARPTGDVLPAPAVLLKRLAAGLERRELAIAVDAADDLPAVAVPESTIAASLATLVENSAQAGARAVTVRAEVEDRALLVEIADDGPGVPEADRERLFEPFFTSRRATGGSGLGLPILRSLLEASRGEIALLPSQSGARFLLRLPLA
jgi:signal transduction histidine kinase